MQIRCADEGMDLFPDTDLPELFYGMGAEENDAPEEEAETVALCEYLVRSGGRILV